MSPGRIALLISILSLLTPPNIFSITFCNIRGLRSNFQSVEHHLSSTKPHLLFLTETQVSEATNSNPFSVPSYFLYPHFRSQAGCCVYVCNDLTCFRAHALESSEFSTIWFRLQSHSLTKFFCAVYLSPNSSDYRKFFDYLTSKYGSLSFCGDLHSWRLQCSPPALAFLSFPSSSSPLQNYMHRITHTSFTQNYY